ncbi:putative protein kinase IRE1 family [Helianthus annuus]|nr:serine/threonine-protein kinase/endoribonuclease IRE1a isoform X1 [Helianthus annuus]KAJ0456461.1 putative protein kinase IRE1 family [Helianthus annuus]KAJ0653048.1 putative protein kinase IRE1 family [Helianthus annuus]
MNVHVFLSLFFILFLFRSIGIVQIYNHIQTVLWMLFGSKDNVPKHEDAELFYRGTINDANFYHVHDDNHDAFTESEDNWTLLAYLQDAFQLVVVVVVALGLYIAFLNGSVTHRECSKKWKTIGKLRVSSTEIAKGSNGTVVFEGIYEGRKVAAKRLVKAHHDVAIQEIQNLIASDQHSNIVRWYGYEYDQDFVYLSLERCDCNIYDLILNKMYSESFQLHRPNGYPSSDLLKLLRDIVAGLVHLHDLGIIHRDLKPRNVLIVKGTSLCGKLADMGISRRLVEDMTSLGPHAQGSGSSGWQAPEQLCHGRQTRAVDLFSLGCVIFFCMTGGRHPFGDTPYERDGNVIDNNKVNMFLVKDVHEAIDLFSQLLNPDPKLRPKASEVLHHPLFWNSEMRMSFLKDTSDRVEPEGRKGGSVVLTALESGGRIVFGGKWNVKMEPTFISNIQRHRWYKYTSVRDLLRVIRNTLNHYREFPMEIQELLGSVPEGSDDYFRGKFPKLLMEVYNVMYHHCKQEAWFRKYLEN